MRFASNGYPPGYVRVHDHHRDDDHHEHLHDARDDDRHDLDHHDHALRVAEPRVPRTGARPPGVIITRQGGRPASADPPPAVLAPTAS
jgi:hypothetical protein